MASESLDTVKKMNPGNEDAWKNQCVFEVHDILIKHSS